MTILEVLCNPRPSSFTHDLAARVREALQARGHDVRFHDLVQERFDPVLDSAELVRGTSFDPLVQAYCADLAAAGGLVVLHPDWWGQPPAILKGWLDRVFRQGVAYDLEGDDSAVKAWKPLLTGKTGVVFCTSDADPGAPRTLESLWVDSVMGRCGMRGSCHVLRDLRHAGPSARRDWQAFVVKTAVERFG